MNFRDWEPSRATELRVKQALAKMTQIIKRLVSGKGKSFIDMLADIAGLSQSPAWIELSNHTARAMVINMATQSARTWRQAGATYGRTHEIHKILKHELEHPVFKRIVRANAETIQSMPSKLALQLTKKVSRHTISGGRAEHIEEELRKAAPHLSESHIRMVARTETAKTQAAINQFRAESINADFFFWRTCQDERVRHTHSIMEGVLCRYSHPPAPEALAGQKSSLGHYTPGNAPNCRCYAEIVLDISEIKFPVKLVIADKIQKVSKKQFINFIGPDIGCLTR